MSHLVIKLPKRDRAEIVPQEFESYETALQYTRTQSFLLKENFYIVAIEGKFYGTDILEESKKKL
jgi:hypothetical protein